MVAILGLLAAASCQGQASSNSPVVICSTVIEASCPISFCDVQGDATIHSPIVIHADGTTTVNGHGHKISMAQDFKGEFLMWIVRKKPVTLKDHFSFHAPIGHYCSIGMLITDDDDASAAAQYLDKCRPQALSFADVPTRASDYRPASEQFEGINHFAPMPAAPLVIK